MKIVPSVTENCSPHSRQTYKIRAGSGFYSVAPVFGLTRSRVPACLTYFDTRLLSQAKQVAPSSQRMDSRKSLEAWGLRTVWSRLLRSFRPPLQVVWPISSLLPSVDDGTFQRPAVSRHMHRLKSPNPTSRKSALVGVPPEQARGDRRFRLHRPTLSFRAELLPSSASPFMSINTVGSGSKTGSPS